MADERKGLNVPIRATGRKDVQRVMRGVVADAEKAARESARAQAAAEREAQRAVAKAEAAKRKEREKSAREAARLAEKSARDQEKSAREAAMAERKIDNKAAQERLRLERFVQRKLAQSISDLSRHRIREAEKSRRAEERLARDADREARRAQSRAARQRVGFRRAMIGGAAMVGGGAIGAGAAAVGVARSAQGALGIRSREEVLGSAIDSRLGFIRTARAAGLDASARENVFGEATAIGRRTGLGPEQILEAINTNQELFSGLAGAVESNTLPQFMGSIEEMANIALASGAELSEVVTTAGEFQRQLSLSGEETSDALAILAQGAQDGSLNFADFAGAFPQALSALSNTRGQEGTGLGAVREFQALAQGLKAGGVGAEQARTLQENLIASFSNTETRRRIERAGVRVLEDDVDAEGNVRRDRRGRPMQRMRNTADIIADMAADTDFQGPQLASIMHDLQARNAAMILMGQEQRAGRGEAGALTLTQRQASSVEGGRKLVSSTVADIMSSDVGGVLKARADRDADIFQNTGELVEHYQAMNGWLTDLEGKYPVLTAQIEAATSVISGLGAAAIGTTIAMKLAGIGAGAGAAGAASAVAATTTAAATTAGAGTGAAAAGGGILARLAVPVALAGVGIGAVNERREGGTFGEGGAAMRGEQRMWAALGNPMGLGLPPVGGDSEAASATESQTRVLAEELQKTRKAIERLPRPSGGATPGAL